MLQPFMECSARGLNKLKLYRSLGLLLYDNRAITYTATDNDVADANLHHVTTAQFAVDSEIEQSAISEPSMLIEKEADGPDVLWFEGTLGAANTTVVPGPQFMKGRVN